MTATDDRRAAEAAVPALLDDLRAWVNIDSGTFDKAGVDAVGRLAQARFASAGFTVAVHPAADVGDQLVARRAGGGTRRLLLIGHLDTVYPTGDAARRPFTVRDGRAYGPGVLDMKSGILAGIAALEIAGDALDRFASVTFLCNSDEEIGSPDSTPLVRQLAADADAVLVLEPTRDVRNAVVGRKGVAAYTLTVAGRAAHAGMAPDSGRNAILELAHLVVALHALHGALPTVSLNVGGIQGGGRRNVVPDHASAIFEVRAANAPAFAQAHAAIRAIVGGPRTVAETTVTLAQGATHQPLEPNAGGRQLFAVAERVAADLGIVLRAQSVGGASDGNTTGGLGIPTLDGLGLVGQAAHHPDEHIVLDLIPVRLALLAGLLRAI